MYKEEKAEEWEMMIIKRGEMYRAGTRPGHQRQRKKERERVLYTPPPAVQRGYGMNYCWPSFTYSGRVLYLIILLLQRNCCSPYFYRQRERERAELYFPSVQREYCISFFFHYRETAVCNSFIRTERELQYVLPSVQIEYAISFSVITEKYLLFALLQLEERQYCIRFILL